VALTAKAPPARPAHLYHGTTAKLEPGDVIESKRGGGRSKVVYLAETAESGRLWAKAKAGRTGGSEPDPNDPTGWGTRTKVPIYVYEVDAPGVTWAKTGWTAPTARVIRRVAHREHGSLPWRDDNPATHGAVSAANGDVYSVEENASGEHYVLRLPNGSRLDGKRVGPMWTTWDDAYRFASKLARGHGSLAARAAAARAGKAITRAQNPLAVRDLAKMTRAELELLEMDVLDREAFGMVNDEIVELRPDQITIAYPGDLEAAEHDMAGLTIRSASGKSRKAKSRREWAEAVLRGAPPVDVSVRGVGVIALLDGHHRYLAAKELGRKIKAKVSIEANPINVIVERSGRRENPVDPKSLTRRVGVMRVLVDATHRRHDAVVNQLRSIDLTVPLKPEQKAAYRAASFEAGIQALYVWLVTSGNIAGDMLPVQAASLMREILQGYDLPPAVREKVEKASRYFSRSRTPARTAKTSPIAYYDRNMAEIDSALAAAEAAVRVGTLHHEAAAKEGTAREIKAGPFTLVNTGGFDRETMERAARVVGRAVEKLEAKGLGQLCYGEVAITNTLAKKTTLAFYLEDKDEMFVRANLKNAEDEAETTILHELAHRYQMKHPKVQRAQQQLFRELERLDDDELEKLYEAAWRDHKPSVGDTFTSPDGKTYTITGFGVVGAKIVLKIKLDGTPLTGRIPAMGYFINKGLLSFKSSAFVTSYAKTSASENFAEMLARWATGALRPDQEALFVKALEASR
jgi:hypothetical protein